MPTTVTIKGVDEDSWSEFKADAILHGETTGSHFSAIIRQHCGRRSWENVDATIARLRKKAGNWSGSREVLKWRRKRAF